MTTSIINSDDGVVSGTSGLKTTGGNDGDLYIQSNGTTVAGVVDGAFQVGGSNISAANSMGFRNRIINGAMVIDQRNAGASGTGNDNFTVDRWAYFGSQASKGTWQQNAGSVTPPTGFSNYLGFTSSSAYSVGATELFAFIQKIEGFNTSDLMFGTANAKTVTLSFWVRSSLTGTFGGWIANSAQSRNYPFSYTISSANTWEQKTVTISGDTTGTWIGATNGIGMRVGFGLGIGSTNSTTANAWNGTTNAIGVTGATSVVGTNGATWYITGVQLEVGSVATEFERRPYGTELALCQRYFEKSYAMDVVPGTGGVPSGFINTFNNGVITNTAPGVYFKVVKRTVPTITLYNGVNGTSGQAYRESDASGISVTAAYPTDSGFPRINLGTSKEDAYIWHFTASAEL